MRTLHLFLVLHNILVFRFSTHTKIHSELLCTLAQMTTLDKLQFQFFCSLVQFDHAVKYRITPCLSQGELPLVLTVVLQCWK